MFLAKPDETIQEHTDRLLNLLDKFKTIYKNYFTENELALIEIASKTHDLGKVNSRFQKKISKKESDPLDGFYKNINIKEIPHGVLSAACIDIESIKDKFSEEDIDVLISSVYNHHDRDIVDKNNLSVKDTMLIEVVKKDLNPNINNLDNTIPCDFETIFRNKIENGICTANNKYEFWLKFIVIKGMLNKLDYAASAHLDEIELTPVNACQYVENVFNKKPNTLWKLNECQIFFKQNQDNNIVAMASTGIGKTEAALLWAGDSKTFYTLPLKVSINAIYKRIIDNEYYDTEKVTFLHSDTLSKLIEKETDFDDADKRHTQTRHFVYPFTVCTIDQLFYFVFKSLGTEKFATTLKYSKVIIDEVQSYSPDIIALIIYGLKVITDLGGKFCIMTATLPPIVEHFMEEELKDRKDNKLKYVKPKSAFLKSELRHIIDYKEGNFDYESIAQNAKIKKVLVICNTVKRAQYTYTKLREYLDDVNLLHSRFVLEDRRKKETDILEFAKNKNAIGIWVSTQIVEASLDIDFDLLYTDMATADSLLQRLGRCYRKRKYKLSEPNVFIIKSDDEKSIGVGSIYDKDIFKFSVDQIKKYRLKPFYEEDKIEYINSVYRKDNTDTEYYKDIKKKLKILNNLFVGSVDKESAKKQFRNIENITIMPRNFYDKLINESKFEEYENAKKNKNRKEKIKLKDYIMNYTTNAHLYFKKHCNVKIPYEDFKDIYITDLKYCYNYGLDNEKEDDELRFIE